MQLKECLVHGNVPTWMTEARTILIMKDIKQLFPDEQKGCKKRSRGTKDQLIIDKTVLKDCRIRKTNLAHGMDRLQEGIRHGITFVDYGMFGHDRGSWCGTMFSEWEHAYMENKSVSKWSTVECQQTLSTEVRGRKRVTSCIRLR